MNPQTEMSTQAAVEENALLSSDLVESSESVSSEPTLQATTSSTGSLINLPIIDETDFKIPPAETIRAKCFCIKFKSSKLE